MLKTGITDLKNIRKDKTLFLKSLKNVSIGLYPDSFDLNDESATERILLTFTDERGAYKRTYGERFESFDMEAIEIVKSRFSGDRQLSVHDLAVSDGRTALDFFEKLSVSFIDLDFTASDYDPFVYIVKDGKRAVALSSALEPLEITYPPFVLNVVKGGGKYFLNGLLIGFLKKFVVKTMIEKYRVGELGARKIELFAPKVVRTAQTHKNFKLRKQNILERLELTYDAIRAMNILNVSYFSPEEFSLILKNVYDGLNPGGIFLTGSNQDANSEVNGAIYEKLGERFRKIRQFGSGSVIDKLITDFTA